MLNCASFPLGNIDKSFVGNLCEITFWSYHFKPYAQVCEESLPDRRITFDRANALQIFTLFLSAHLLRSKPRSLSRVLNTNIEPFTRLLGFLFVFSHHFHSFVNCNVLNSSETLAPAIPHGYSCVGAGINANVYHNLVTSANDVIDCLAHLNVIECVM